MDNKNLDISTEKRILDAARSVFTQKGFAATRMDDIAKEAGINRALLNYYYRSKDRIFEIIFKERLKEFFSGIAIIIQSEQPVEEKIRALVIHDISTIQQHPDMPLFVIGEINRNPERFVEFVTQTAGIEKEKLIQGFQKQIDREVKEGKLKPINARQLMMNTMSLAIYPSMAKPIIKTMFSLSDAEFDKLMEGRKKEVTDFILNSIKA